MRTVQKINEVEKTKYLEFKIKTTNNGSDNSVAVFSQYSNYDCVVQSHSKGNFPYICDYMWYDGVSFLDASFSWAFISFGYEE